MNGCFLLRSFPGAHIAADGFRLSFSKKCLEIKFDMSSVASKRFIPKCFIMFEDIVFKGLVRASYGFPFHQLCHSFFMSGERIYMLQSKVAYVFQLTVTQLTFFSDLGVWCGGPKVLHE